MRTPAWLAAELETICRRLAEGDIGRDEAIELAMDAAAAKDPDLMAQIHYEWIAGRLDDAYSRLQTKAVRELDRHTEQAARSEVQPTLDDELFPGPDSTLLAVDGEYAYDLLGRSERHHERAKRRVTVYEQRVDAVGGNLDGNATRGQAIAALHRATGDEAAEG